MLLILFVIGVCHIDIIIIIGILYQVLFLFV